MTKIIPPNDLLPGPSAVLRNITHFLLKFHREYFVVVFYHDTCWYCFASTWREHATVVVASGSVIFSSRGFASGGWECCECREDDCEVKLDDHLKDKSWIEYSDAQSFSFSFSSYDKQCKRVTKIYILHFQRVFIFLAFFTFSTKLDVLGRDFRQSERTIIKLKY